MTSSNSAFEAEETSGRSTIRNILFLVLGTLVMVFAAGLIVGFVTVAAEHGWAKPVKAAFVIAGGIALAAGGGWLAWRGWRGFTGSTAPVAPRTKRARSMLYLSLGLGAVLGFLLPLSGNFDDPVSLVAGPLPPLVAIVAIAVWLIAVPIISWLWWKNVDEVEADAYKTGALWAVYAYCFIAPSWWIGWRGSFLPQPQEMVTFLIVMAIWGIGWMRGRM